jgi:uncharacterized protein YhfF
MAVSTYLPSPALAPSATALEAFRVAAMSSKPSLALDGVLLEPRWIGLDQTSTHAIFHLIRIGDKRGTFTLPWIVERTNTPTPAVGNHLVLIDMDGTPTLLVRVTRVDRAIFGAVRAEHTAIDGSPVRDPHVWVPLHTQYWNNHLAPFDLTVSPDMPFWIEEFELLYDSGHAQEMP